ncbi:MAG: acyltransferase [Gemmataceae bacterium]
MADTSQGAYRSQLDTLRFVAFLGVWLFHANEQRFTPGSLGVPLFFVLSGFLITRILILNESGSLFQELLTFYGRRTLRIFPLYYAVLLVLLVVGMLPNPLWYFFYLHNVYIFLHDAWTGPTNHFWSLCVEEQFYLLYPLLLLLTPARFRWTLLGALLAGSVLSRLTLDWYYPGSRAWALLPVSGEYLLWGCLAGLADLHLPERSYSWLVALGAGLVCATGLDFYHLRWLGAWGLHLLYQSLFGVGFTLILFGTWRLPDGWWLRLLCLPPIVYLGRISYGLYVFHNFFYGIKPWLVEWLPPLRVIPAPALALATTILMAVLSWHLFEAPINRLKERLSYRR